MQFLILNILNNNIFVSDIIEPAFDSTLGKSYTFFLGVFSFWNMSYFTFQSNLRILMQFLILNIYDGQYNVAITSNLYLALIT